MSVQIGCQVAQPQVTDSLAAACSVRVKAATTGALFQCALLPLLCSVGGVS